MTDKMDGQRTRGQKDSQKNNAALAHHNHEGK